MDAGTPEQQLCRVMLVELLAHQFCSPVKWTETQDILLSQLHSKRFVEIGPSETLTNMMRRTRDLVWGPYDTANMVSREMVSLKTLDLANDAVQDESEDAVPVASPSSEGLQQSRARGESGKEGDLRPPAPATELLEGPESVHGDRGDVPRRVEALPDARVEAVDIIRTIVATALKTDAKELNVTKSLKTLSGGRSTVQNEMVGDLDAEFGASLPPGSSTIEDMSLHDLAVAVERTEPFASSPSLGKRSRALLDRLFSAKMPAGFSQSEARRLMQTDFGLMPGRQDTILLLALQSQPAARLGSEKLATDYMSSCVQAYVSAKAITIPTQRPHQRVRHKNIDPKVWDELTSKSDRLHRELSGAYAKHLGSTTDVDAPSPAATVNLLQSKIQSLEEELQDWRLEHSSEYAAGIKPLFDSHKARVYDSWWAWALQDLFQVYHAIRRGTLSLVLDEAGPSADVQLDVENEGGDQSLRQRRHALVNRSSARLIDALSVLVAAADAEKDVVDPGLADDLHNPYRSTTTLKVWLDHLLADCQSALQISRPPTALASETSAKPATIVDDDGAVRVVEKFRSYSAGADRWSRLRAPTGSSFPITETESRESRGTLHNPLPPTPSRTPSASAVSDDDGLPRFTQAHSSTWTSNVQQLSSDGSWETSANLSDEYAETLSRAVTTGLALQGKTVLVTGSGQRSIGAKVVQLLLSGGARVIVTTSSAYPKAARGYQRMFTKFGARGSSLMVLPVNQASQQDVENFIQHIYSIGCDHEQPDWDLDFVIPFAAMGELANGVDLGPKSELAHRLMLANTLRLLGAVKRAKEERRIRTRPAQVVLPLSPNHGVFGGDGLYSESKLGLEGLFNKWSSEDWGDYLCLSGATIGWTRGTGLMNDNDVVAEGIENLGVRTFSQEEMAVNVVALIASPLLSKATQMAPLKVDLSGGMSAVANFKAAVASIRTTLQNTASTRRLLALEYEQDAKLLAEPAPSLGFLAPFRRRANFKLDFPKVPHLPRGTDGVSDLQDMVDLERVVVVVGFGEVGPYGSSRTRWQMESQGHYTTEGWIEMAWMMGLIEYQTTDAYTGWARKDNKKPVADDEVRHLYEEHILAHTGIRDLEPSILDGPDPKARQVLHEMLLQHDLSPFEVSKDVASDLEREHGSHVTISPVPGSDYCTAVLHRGARLMVPKSIAFHHGVAGRLPTGWSPRAYGISEEIINQVDPVTLYALVSTAEALLSAGVTDPYEFYKHIHVSQLAICVGSGFGGAASLQAIYKERVQDKAVQNDILAESFLNTASAWINMLLLSSAGPNITPVGACATALESLDVGCQAITSGRAKVAVVGGHDYYSKYIAAEFANMKATNNASEDYARGRTASEMSRPATTSRAGFVEAEGCGIQILTTARLAVDMGLPIHGIIALTRTASDGLGRSLPAPGQGIVTVSASAKSSRAAGAGTAAGPSRGFGSPILDLSYRRRCMKSRMAQIQEYEAAELEFLGRELSARKCDAPPSGGYNNAEAEEHKAFRIACLASECAKQRQEAQRCYGSQFWETDDRISPLQGALAGWGLTVDDLHVASFHGTSTVKNELNECAVLQAEMDQLGRTRGKPLHSVFQKHLTGHPKGAAAAWMLNGALQIMNDRLVPGHGTADNIDCALQPYDHITFSNEALPLSGDVDAFLVSSFGFGQKGAQAVGIHPKHLFAALDGAEYGVYRDKLHRRQQVARQQFQSRIMNNCIFQAKEHAPYSKEDHNEFLINLAARLPIDGGI